MSSLTYDKTGNLIGDVSEGIDRINWTVYGKIASIQKAAGYTSYNYDATGNRITKKLSATREDYYVRDAQGNILALYSYNDGSLTWGEQHLYGSSRLGMVTPGFTIQSATPLSNANYNATGDPITNGTEGKRIYELTNHLVNVMVTISDRKIGVDENSDGTVDYYAAEVLTSQDYYAFGMLMPGRTYSNAGAKYKYGFNGKENDNEVKGEGNQQDYGMRIYDPRVGRFLSVDPLTRSYPWYTPYQFAGNKPIIAVDLDGLEEYIVINYYNRTKELERTSIITLTNKNSTKLVDMQMRAVMRNDRLGSLEAQGKKVLVRHVFSDNARMFASERRDILIQNETHVLNNGRKLNTGNENPFQIEINEGGKMVSEKDDYKSNQFNLEEKTASFYEHKIIRPNEKYTFKPFDVSADIIEVLPSGKKQAEKFATSLKNSGIKEVTIQPVVVTTSTENILRNGKTLREAVTANYKLLGEIIEKVSGVKVTVLPTKRGEGNSNLQIQTK